MQPLVSVIIPVYNTETYLKKCIDSVVNQTLYDIEIICVNDGSTDNSLNIINEYSKKDNRIKIVNQRNGGRSSARNAGVKIATGRYIMFCDSDDTYKQNMCEILYNAIKNNKTDIACCEIDVNYEADHNLVSSDKNYYSLKFNGKKECATDDLLKIDGSVCNKIFDKTLIDKFGIIFPEGLVYEDTAFFFMYYSICQRAYFIKQPLYIYNRHEGSIMNETLKGSEKAIDHLKIMDVIYNHLQNNKLWEKYKNIFFEAYVLYFDFAFRYSKKKSKKVVFDYAIKFLNKFNKKDFIDLPDKIKNALKNIKKRKCTNETKHLTFWQKLFFVGNKYKNGKKYKRIVIFGLSFNIKCGKRDDKKAIKRLIKKVYPQYRKKHRLLINKLREQVKIRKIRVCFLVSETQKWNMQSLYDEMEKSDIFEPFVVVTNLKSMIMRNTQEHNLEFFKQRCNNVQCGFDEKKNESIDLKKFNPDIVFYQQPWDLWNNQEADYVLNFALPYYFSYAIADASSCLKDHFKSFYLALHKYFIFSQEDENSYYEMYGYKSINTSIVGHPKLDVYKNYKPENYEKKYVIYAPHHSFLPNSILNYGTFDWNGKYILKWAKAHPELNWIFKPHPLLKQILLSSDIMNEAEIEEYYNDWEKLGTYYNDGDYFDLFKSSKCMITDCGSFLTEYLPTQSPVIHLRNPKGTDYVASNKLAMEAYYKAWNVEQLEELLNDILIKQKDIKKEDRSQALKTLGIEEYNSTEKIIRIIENELI